MSYINHPSYTSALPLCTDILQELSAHWDANFSNYMHSVIENPQWHDRLNQYLYNRYGNLPATNDFDLRYTLRDFVVNEVNNVRAGMNNMQPQYGGMQFAQQPQQNVPVWQRSVYGQQQQVQPQMQQCFPAQPQYGGIPMNQQPYMNQFQQQPQYGVYQPFQPQPQPQPQPQQFYPNGLPNGLPGVMGPSLSSIYRRPNLTTVQQSVPQQPQPMYGQQPMQQPQQPQQVQQVQQVQPRVTQEEPIEDDFSVSLTPDGSEPVYTVNEADDDEIDAEEKVVGARYDLDKVDIAESDCAPSIKIVKYISKSDSIPLEEIADFSAKWDLILRNENGIYMVVDSTIGLIAVPYEEGIRLHRKCMEALKKGRGELDAEIVTEINDTLRSEGDAGSNFKETILELFNEAAEVCLQQGNERGGDVCMPTVDSLDEIESLVRGTNLPESLNDIVKSKSFKNRLGVCLRESYGALFGRGPTTCLKVDNKQVMYSVLNKLKAKFKGYDTTGSSIFAALRDDDTVTLQSIHRRVGGLTPIAIPRNYIDTDEFDIPDTDAEYIRIPRSSHRLIRNLVKDKVAYWHNQRNNTWYLVGIGVDGKLALHRKNI